MRWAPLIHDFLKWLWPAVGTALGAIGGLAIAASQVWATPKEQTARAFGWIAELIRHPSFWVILALICLVWLLAFLWSGQLASNTAPTKRATRQARPLAIAGSRRDQLMQELRVAVASRLALVMERYLSVIFGMFNECTSKEPRTTCDELLDRGIRRDFADLVEYVRREDGDPQVAAEKLAHFLTVYLHAQSYVHRFAALCQKTPDPAAVRNWLDADRECLPAIRDLRAKGLLKALDRVDDAVFAHGRFSASF